MEHSQKYCACPYFGWNEFLLAKDLSKICTPLVGPPTNQLSVLGGSLEMIDHGLWPGFLLFTFFSRYACKIWWWVATALAWLWVTAFNNWQIAWSIKTTKMYYSQLFVGTFGWSTHTHTHSHEWNRNEEWWTIGHNQQEAKIPATVRNVYIWQITVGAAVATGTMQQQFCCYCWCRI